MIGTAFHYYNGGDAQALLAMNQTNTFLTYYKTSTDAAFGDPTGTDLGTIQAASFFVGNSISYSTVNSTVYSGTANNASYLNQKTESNLNVNNAVTSNTANNTTYVNGKTEGNLNVNNAVLSNTANNASYLNNKTESNLNVNNSVTSNTATYIIANTGLVSNSSGVFVNATYIASLSSSTALNANNASYLNNKLEKDLNVNSAVTSNTANNASYLNNKTESNLNVNSAVSSNTANNTTYVNNKTEGNLNVNNALTANNSSFLSGKHENDLNVNTAIFANTANNTTYVNSKTESNLNVNNAVTSNTANTASYIIANTGLVSNSSGVFVNAAYINTISANAATYLNGKTESNLNVNSAVNANSANNASYLNNKTESNLNVNSAINANSANNASYLGTVAAASYVQNTDSRTLSGNLNFTGANSYFSGKVTYAANIVINSGVSIIDSTGGRGSAGQVLTSNGTGNVYWATISGGGSGVNTAAAYAFTNTAVSGNATSGAITTAGGLGVANNLYVGGRVGFSNSTNISVAYTYYNANVGALDTVFG